MKNAALLSWYRNGRLNTASSATSARPSVRTRPSDRYSSRRKKWKNPAYRRNPPLVPRTFISALLCRPWTARAAATASTPARPRKRPSWPNQLDTQRHLADAWNYFMEDVTPKKNPMNKYTLKGSQFEKPLLEFSGACAGCGENAVRQARNPALWRPHDDCQRFGLLPPSGAVPHLEHARTRRMPLAMVRLGPIPLKTTPNTDLACIWAPRPAVSRSRIS